MQAITFAMAVFAQAAGNPRQVKTGADWPQSAY